MNFMLTVGSCALALFVVKVSQWLYRWSNPKCNGKLPPGSMGFPIIGETFDFFKTHGVYEISPFVKTRMSRYGTLFRTNILGSKTIVSTDMDVNKEILRQENKSFVSLQMETMSKVIGKDNLFLNNGKIHKHVKQITLNFLGSEGLKRNLIRDMDRVTREHLESKATQGSFDVKDAVSSLIVAYMTPKMISNLKPEAQRKLASYVKAFNLDWVQGTLTLHTLRKIFKAIRARIGGTQVIKNAYTMRKESEEKHADFVDTILEDFAKDGSFISQDSLANLVFIISFGAHELTSSTIPLVVKLLSENPKVLAELKAEHEAIIGSRENKDFGISWEEYRYKMSFTNMVINEALRMINFAHVLFRKAVNDVDIKGYTIPAGWTVLTILSVVHHDPEVYENPLEFNPWRWEEKDVRAGSKTFVAFGGGMRQCAGAEFARLQISIFLHYLVTKYDFSVVQDCEVIRKFGLHFLKDLRINISPSHNM